MFLTYTMEVHANLKILIWYKRGHGHSWVFFPQITLKNVGITPITIYFQI